MRLFPALAASAAAMLSIASSAAWAGPVPSKISASSAILGDDALITLSNYGVNFQDTGLLPITGFVSNGKTVTPNGYGTSWGAYIAYSGTGTQTFYNGTPVSVTFNQLSYQILTYAGQASFGLDANGNPAITGSVSQPTVIDQGTLISGGLVYNPDYSISGTVRATTSGGLSQLIGGSFNELDVNFYHPLTDYMPVDLNGDGIPDQIRIQAQAGSSATLVPTTVTKGSKHGLDTLSTLPSADSAADPAPVPEPASLPVLAAGLAALGCVAARKYLRG